MKLTKIQKDEAIKKLSSIYGYVHLMCDGYKVSLVVERTSALSFRIMTYVNGSFKGLWVDGGSQHPEQKFLRKRVRSLYSNKFISEMEKIYGKKHVAKDCKFKKVYTTFYQTSLVENLQLITYAKYVSQLKLLRSKR